MIDYLREDDRVFRDSPERLAYAVDELLRLALQCAQSFRLEFDPVRLKRVIGDATFSKLMPELVRPRIGYRSEFFSL